VAAWVATEGRPAAVWAAVWKAASADSPLPPLRASPVPPSRVRQWQRLSASSVVRFSGVSLSVASRRSLAASTPGEAARMRTRLRSPVHDTPCILRRLRPEKPHLGAVEPPFLTTDSGISPGLTPLPEGS
jgi:hypothetical protein